MFFGSILNVIKSKKYIAAEVTTIPNKLTNLSDKFKFTHVFKLKSKYRINIVINIVAIIDFTKTFLTLASIIIIFVRIDVLSKK